MTHQPTRGATEPVDAHWVASPVAARAVRLAALAFPVLGAWLAVRLGGQWFWRPDGRVGHGVWLGQAVVVSVVVSVTISRWSRRLLPLAMLLNLSLVFPDQAPSRFGVALRSGSPRHLRARLDALATGSLGHDAPSAAAAAMELVAGLSSHDRRTRGHTERVRAYAELIAQELGMSDEDRLRLAWGVLLHDVGKLTVPADILNKQEPLTDDEWQILRQHPEAGRAMVAPLETWLGPWIDAAGDHHERWDGTGYPRGLAGSDISLAGRITAVADAFDVITSARSYKTPLSVTAARQELVRCAGAQFDPAVVRAMLSVSLGRSRNWGSLAWIAELPQLARLTTGVAQSTVTASIATSAMAIGAIGLTGAPGPGQPEQLALLPMATATTVASGATAESTVETTTADSGPGGDSAATTTPPDAASTTTSPDPEVPISPSVDAAVGSATTTIGAKPTVEPNPTATVSLPSATTLIIGTPTAPTPSQPPLPAPTPPLPVPPLPDPAQVLSLWLTNPGSVATISEAILPLGTTGPTVTALANFDTDRDDVPGLQIKRDGAGLSTLDATKRQDWHHRFDTATTLDGTASVTLHLAEKSLAGGSRIGVKVGLYRCLLLVCSSEIASGTWTGTSRAGGFEAVTIPLGTLSQSIPSGYSLRLRVVVPDELGDTDVALAYDTVAHPSRLTIG